MRRFLYIALFHRVKDGGDLRGTIELAYDKDGETCEEEAGDDFIQPPEGELFPEQDGEAAGDDAGQDAVSRRASPKEGRQKGRAKRRAEACPSVGDDVQNEVLRIETEGDRDGVEINTYSVIYDAIDDVTSAMVGMLDKVKKEIVTGQVEVQQVFKISKVGTVAGCIVTEGKVHSKDKGRVIRDGIVIHTAPISALKRYKDDVKEVVTGLECGISLVNYNDLQTGDMIETFTEIEVEQKL